MVTRFRLQIYNMKNKKGGFLKISSSKKYSTHKHFGAAPCSTYSGAPCSAGVVQGAVPKRLWVLYSGGAGKYNDSIKKAPARKECGTGASA